MNKVFFKSIWLSITTILILATSCSSDNDYFEFERSKPNEVGNRTRSAYLDYSDYLTISSYEMGQWTEKDYDAINKAIGRIGICFSESQNRYVFNVSDANDVNISDSLYKCVTRMITYTNSIMLKSKEMTITRAKTRSSETVGPLPDCVPAAIANMGVNAPSYETAIAKCDEMFPNWRTTGGVPIDNIESFIEVYTSVTEHTDLNVFPDGETLLNNNVMVFASHAVNAYRIFKSSISPVIYYSDYSSSSTGGGFILAGEMKRIYTFN